MAGYIDDKWYQVTKKHPRYATLLQAVLVNDEVKFIEVYNDSVVSFSCEHNNIDAKIHITNESITYRDQTITDPTVIAVIKSYGTKCDALKRFVDNLFLNPHWASIQQLGEFLKHNNFPLTEDGCFLGYKAVQRDWRDIHSGTNKNIIGAVISMPRDQVTFDPEVACSAGLHVGTYEYASGFGGSASRLLIVKVNPAHCVSVPYDYNHQKLRCSQYTVLGECDEPLPMDIVYDMDGTQVRVENWFADMRNEELERKRRPAPSTLGADDVPDWAEDEDDDYDYDDDDDGDSETYYCDNCGWEEDVDSVNIELTYCPECGNELLIK